MYTQAEHQLLDRIAKASERQAAALETIAELAKKSYELSMKEYHPPKQSK